MNTTPGLVIDARFGWTEDVVDLAPGAHVAVLADDVTVGIEGRLAGLYLRDTILVLRAGRRTGFVFLFRKPVAEGTIAEQVVATGTGALNIDKCRVGSGGAALVNLVVGRWPTNLVLVHGAGCTRTGTNRVRASGGHYDKPRSHGGTYAQDAWTKGKMRNGTTDHADPDGKETVAVWECEPGCPVPVLDEQSGILSTHGGASTGAMASMGFTAAPEATGRSPPTRASHRASSRSSQTKARCARGSSGSSAVRASRTKNVCDCLTDAQARLTVTARPAHGPMSPFPTTLGFKAARRRMLQSRRSSLCVSRSRGGEGARAWSEIMSNFKKMVQARIDKTGESWSTAAGHVRAAGRTPENTPEAPVAVPQLIENGAFVFNGTSGPPDGDGFFVTDGKSAMMGPFIRDGAVAVREHLATIIVAAFEAAVPGRASATTGPGPMATVRYYVEGTPIVFSAIVFGDKIESQIGTEPQGGILWGIKENPLTDEGARNAASQMIEWLSTQIDIRAIAEEFNVYTVTDIRIALDRVGKHPRRGPETSYDAVTGNGKVSAGQPVAGVQIRRDGDSYRFRLTEVSGELYSWDELSMKTTSFAGFVHAMRDLLRR